MSPRNAIRGKQLYKILFFGAILTVIAVGALAFWGVREVRRDAAVVAVENSARGLSGAVTILVNSVAASNEEIRAKGLASLNPEILRKRFMDTLEAHPNLIAISLSDKDGMLYSMSRRFDGLVECSLERNEAKAERWMVSGKDGVFRPSESKFSFDRTVADRNFAAEFAQLRPGDIRWRSTYRFLNDGEFYLAASTLVEEGGKEYMMSFMFPVEAVADQLVGAEKGSAERVYLYWKSGRVLPVAGLYEFSTFGESSRVVDLDKIEDPVIHGAAQSLFDGKHQDGTPFSYNVDGETWWAYVMPLSVFDNTISLGVAVPRKNIVSTLTSDTFLQVFGAILIFFAFVVLFVIHKNKARIEAMGLRAKAAKDASDILHLIAEGEGRSLEFKQTLRFNLKAGKNGKEIEHASLKTVAGFLNSEGGTLLVGVSDDGLVAGFEEDKFESEDKALLHFNNLVNQHIGTEFARYVDTKIITVEGKQVLRAYCMPAAVPAILVSGKNEEFYVRSGPASRQLTLSQFYEWLQNH